MTTDRFDATFRIRIDRTRAWQRLVGDEIPRPDQQLWLAGFESQVTVVDVDPDVRLRATKGEEPCAGTDIVVTLEDGDSGTRIHVVQSGFGDFLRDHHEAMAVGWKYIVADLRTYLATGVAAHRHLRPWGDLGADATATDGGLLIDNVRDGGLADRLGLVDGDLLVVLAGAPVATVDDLTTVLRVLGGAPTDRAEWIRAGRLSQTT